MESNTNPDPVALALRIQSLTATVEELTRQNQEMMQRLQQEGNRPETNKDDEGDSHRRRASTNVSSDLLREMRKEMDELRNAIKGKIDQSLDKMVKKTDIPFTLAVQECPVPSKFCLPQLEPFNGVKDPLDHLNTFKTTLGF